MIRALILVLAAIASLPVMNFAFGLISAQSDMSVVEGVMVVVLLVAAWCWIADNYFRFFRREWSEMLKRLGFMFLMVATAVASVGCGRTIVEPGHVGIQVDYYGQDRGVESYPKVTGVVWYNPVTTAVFQFPTFVQTASWTANVNEGHPVNEEMVFTTADQMVVKLDVSLAYHLVPEKVPAFYVKFRSSDISLFTHGFLRNLAREKFDTVAGKYRIEQIMGDNGPFLKETRDLLQKELTPLGVELDQFGLIGAPRPPDSVVAAINMKVQATQDAIRVENELRQSRAQAEKDVAKAEGEARAQVATAEGDAKAVIARATGDAKANQLMSQSITGPLIEWRRLTIQQESVAKWAGQVPTYMAGSAPIPFLSIEKEK